MLNIKTGTLFDLHLPFLITPGGSKNAAILLFLAVLKEYP